jgi:tRNA threonylcarbamoyladenosine biosynthesis protein TsaE
VARTAPSALDPSFARVALDTTSADQTRGLAAALAVVARPGDRIALIGPLGAGKTQFAKGFAAGLGVRDVVNSPSFTLMAEYQGRVPLFHQDLYRLAGAEEVLSGGLLDLRQDGGVTLTEWAERLPAVLDTRRLDVVFAIGGDDERTIELVARDPRYHRYLEAAARWAPAEDAARTGGG